MSVISFIRLTVCTEGGIVILDVADLVLLGLDGLRDVEAGRCPEPLPIDK